MKQDYATKEDSRNIEIAINNAVRLILAHAEKDEEAFEDAVIDIVRELRKNYPDTSVWIQDFIMAATFDCCRLVPMAVEGEK